MLLIPNKHVTRRSCIHNILYIFFVLLLGILVCFLWPQSLPDDTNETLIKIRKNLDIEMACHYKKDIGLLPTVKVNTKFANKSIFFIEATCSGLNSRQACSVESAARANPEYDINLLFTSSISWKEYRESVISNFVLIPNVNPMRIFVEDYAEGTAFYKKLKDNNTRSELTMTLADILKFLTAYKYPGIYLPLDVIIVRSLRDLSANWIVKETPGSVTSDIFSFSHNRHGRALADITMNTLVSDATLPEQNLWSFDYPTLLRKVIYTWCGITDLRSLTSTNCPGLQVIEPEKFFPISFYQRNQYFEPNYKRIWQDRNIYGYQIWERFTKYIMITNNSLFMQLAKEYCPITYEYYNDGLNFV